MTYKHLPPPRPSSARNGVITGAASLLILASGAALAQSTGQATINVTGAITGSTCTLTTSNIILDMGSVTKAALISNNGIGPSSPARSLVFDSCDASLITMTFQGAVEPESGDFAPTGGAQGVGILLTSLNPDGSVYKYVTPNTPIEYPTATFNNQYSFRARYNSANPSAITTGQGNATITVLLTYT